MIERIFKADHPALQGHFPGNPVIPGALLLSETLQAIGIGSGANRVPFQITSAKFLRPTLPGDRVLIEFSHGARGEIRFTCAVSGKPVLTGKLSCHVLSRVT